MNLTPTNFKEWHFAFRHIPVWIIFILFIVISGITMAHHEMWGDEIHSWNIAKGSQSFLDLLNNSRYEGHPPLWYFVLWSISKFSHNMEYVQVVHLIFAILTVFLLLFFSPFPFFTKILIPFGYFFLFEYTVISRNYGIAVLLAFCICLLIRTNLRYKLGLYYFLLFLLCNTHLLGILLAASLHLYFLLLNEMKMKRAAIVLHCFLGVLVALPAIYFIFPPADSELGIQFWMNRLDSNKLTAFIQTPIKAFLPFPAWWEYNFWNTQFLIEAKNRYTVFRFINLFIALSILLLVFVVLKKNRKSIALFLTNLLLSFIISVISITLTSERHAGYLFITFIVAYWLLYYETIPTSKMKWLVNTLLIVQLAGGIFAVVKDIRYPFSNSYKIGQLMIEQVPKNEKIVTDYWGLNTISAFLDKPAYCIDIQKEVSFIKWDNELKKVIENKYRYYDGISNYFKNNNVKTVFMISTASPSAILQIDIKLSTAYHVALIEGIEGAIEKHSNLYLYRIDE